MKLQTSLIFENAKPTKDGVTLNIYHKQRYNIEVTREEAAKLRDQLSDALNCTIEENGDMVWADPSTGLAHREGGPAIITHKGGLYYYQQGLPHRIGGPAQIFTSGLRKYYYKGKLHRPAQDGPALIYPDGQEAYYVDGVAVLPPPPKTLPVLVEEEKETPKKKRFFALKKDSWIRKSVDAFTDWVFWKRIF